MTRKKSRLNEPNRYRTVDVAIHADAKVLALSKPQPNGESLWFYLITCGHDRSIPGLLVVSPGAIAHRFGWTDDDVRRVFSELETSGLAIADHRAGLVWLPKTIMPGRNEPKSADNIVGYGGRNWREVPECDLKWRAYRAFATYCATRGERFLGAAIAAFDLPPVERDFAESLRKCAGPEGGAGGAPEVGPEGRTEGDMRGARGGTASGRVGIEDAREAREATDRGAESFNKGGHPQGGAGGVPPEQVSRTRTVFNTPLPPAGAGGSMGGSDADAGEDPPQPLDLIRTPPPAPPPRSPVLQVFDHYRCHHPAAFNTPQPESKEWRAIKARLKEGSSVEDLCDAIDGCHLHPFNNGTETGHKQVHLGLIVRDGSNVARFAEVKRKGPPPPRRPPATSTRDPPRARQPRLIDMTAEAEAEAARKSQREQR